MSTAQRELLETLQAATLGEFEVFHQLGRGGMATVFLAHDIALDRPVAIKVMSPALLLQEGMAERFRREARTAASLNHPHIIPIYAVRPSDRVLFFVMKYVEGRPLDQIIKEFSPLPFDTTQRILAQVGSALGYAHRKGVIHRDVKPANIMIDVDGWAIVTDFGIARVAGAPGLTDSGAAVGTPHYMSPEQYSTEEITGRSDQYSLGVLAYELVTGRLPFPGQMTGEVIKGHLLDTPPPITALRPECPPVLVRVVMRMLEKEAAHRWPSIEEAIAELRLPPAPEEDPVRTGLITLAKSGPQRPSMPRPPSSPVPLSKARIGLGGVAAGFSGNVSRSLSRGAGMRLIAGVGLVATLLVAGVVIANRKISAAKQETVTPGSKATADTVVHSRSPAAPPPTLPPPAPPALVRSDSARGIRPSGARSVRATAKSSGLPASKLPLVRQPVARDSVRDSLATTAPPPAPVSPWGWVMLGTKNDLAFVYLNGVVQLSKGPRVRFWKVPVGKMSLSVAAEGCAAWDTVVTVVPGDTIKIGNRYPQCVAPR